MQYVHYVCVCVLACMRVCVCVCAMLFIDSPTYVLLYMFRVSDNLKSTAARIVLKCA